ncbi:TfoX/Sxy family protein [Nakamurella deserti]|uniref:TfoX/Sxy family protein n=1 Tax=Nakamurella deserti TaxID=2164074 RepID=UPI000DBE02FE|nr:TfoX/Sxy family protein [Nakamurella deserti]
MAYDRDLADRIRAVLDDQPDLTEKAMFGGLGFMVNGNMGVAAAGHGGLMVRVGPAEADGLIADGSAARMVMQGRELAGWVLVPAGNLVTESELERWVRTGTGYASTLPPK